jgi:hypothetical protein
MRGPLAALTLLVLATCAPPFPVHRGEGGVTPQGQPADVDSGAAVSPPEDDAAAGGSPGTGGSATGGTPGTGGVPGTGGSATGGVPGTGGSATGGAVGTGGVVGTGGRGGTGGAVGTGGRGGTGGSSTGGTTGTGGASGTGGSSGGCSDVAVWKAGTYKGGDEVKNGTPAHRYRCREYPFEGWCGISAYEPGGGGPWMDAWVDRGACP